jgi:hypothetical protein
MTQPTIPQARVLRNKDVRVSQAQIEHLVASSLRLEGLDITADQLHELAERDETEDGPDRP